MNSTGRCLCGAVTFTAEELETGLHICHCSMCRRWVGGPSFSVSAGRVRFDGEAQIGRYASSAWAERGFCKQCGSSLFYRLRQTDRYILNMGSFDNQEAFATASEIYIDDKPSGYAIAGEHPRLTGEEFLASLGQT